MIKYKTMKNKIEKLNLSSGTIVDKINEIIDVLNGEETDNRFIDNKDGTITDTKTKKMWQKEGSEERTNWEDAKIYCERSEDGGHKDWRLPTREELESILDLERHNIAINPIFKCEEAGYWTFTTLIGSTDDAWVVALCDGSIGVGYKASEYFVRAVRDINI